MTQKEELHTICARVARVTRAAIALEPPIYRGNIALYWIPKRAIVDSDTEIDEIEVGDRITIEIPEWLARQKGLSE